MMIINPCEAYAVWQMYMAAMFYADVKHSDLMRGLILSTLFGWFFGTVGFSITH